MFVRGAQQNRLLPRCMREMDGEVSSKIKVKMIIEGPGMFSSDVGKQLRVATKEV